MENIKLRIQKILTEILDIKKIKIKNTTHLIDDLKVDSLDMIEIIMSIEQEFNIEIPDEEIEKFKTIQSIIQYIQKKKNKNIIFIKK